MVNHRKSSTKIFEIILHLGIGDVTLPDAAVTIQKSENHVTNLVELV